MQEVQETISWFNLEFQQAIEVFHGIDINTFSNVEDRTIWINDQSLKAVSKIIEKLNEIQTSESILCVQQRKLFKILSIREKYNIFYNLIGNLLQNYQGFDKTYLYKVKENMHQNSLVLFNHPRRVLRTDLTFKSSVIWLLDGHLRNPNTVTVYLLTEKAAQEFSNDNRNLKPSGVIEH
uniref:Uncharacterized protein n=1 Tax=Megaselia scalaris TaxID=36166 RepID=T1GLJ4_MEGSC